MTEHELDTQIIEMLLKQHSIKNIAKVLETSLDNIDKVIKENTSLINDIITSKLPIEWQDKLNNDVTYNINIYHLYIKSLCLTDELLDLKTKHTYYHLLEQALNPSFTKSQAQVLGSLLSYFAKSLEQ